MSAVGLADAGGGGGAGSSWSSSQVELNYMYSNVGEFLNEFDKIGAEREFAELLQQIFPGKVKSPTPLSPGEAVAAAAAARAGTAAEAEATAATRSAAFLKHILSDPDWEKCFPAGEIVPLVLEHVLQLTHVGSAVTRLQLTHGGTEEDTEARAAEIEARNTEVAENWAKKFGRREFAEQLAKWHAFITTAQPFLSRLLPPPDSESGSEWPVSGVLWAGSVAKQTAVSPDVADIDLVLVCKHYEPCEEFVDKMLTWVETKLREGPDIVSELSRRAFYFRHATKILPAVQQQQPGSEPPVCRCSYITQSATSPEPEYLKREAKYIQAKYPNGKSVDILIGGELPPLAHAFSRKNEAEWVHWGPSCTTLCVDFVMKQPSFVRTAIRALKAWRDSLGIKQRGRRPSSFLMELICIHAYQTIIALDPAAGDAGSTSAQDVFWASIRILSSPAAGMNILWTEETGGYYALDLIPPEVLAQRPLVLDPVKPWNNVVRASNLKWAQRHALKALTLQPKPVTKPQKAAPALQTYCFVTTTSVRSGRGVLQHAHRCCTTVH